MRVKNRMRVIRSSGSVRGGAGNIPAYSAEGLRQRGRRACLRIGFVEPGEARIGVGMQMAATASQQGMGVLGLAVGRVEVEGRRRRGRSVGPLVSHRRP